MHPYAIIRSALVLAAAALAHAGAAAAQQGAVVPSHSLAVTLGQTNGVEAWQRLSPRVELGLALDARIERTRGDDPATRATHLDVGPRLKVFVGPDAPVRPFVYAAAGYLRDRTDVGDPGEGVHVQTGASGTLGAGLEWSPVPRISIGGFGGLYAGHFRKKDELHDGAGFAASNADQRTAGIFQSGIRAQYRF